MHTLTYTPTLTYTHTYTQTWEAPPSKRLSSQCNLAGALALIKGKQPREEAIIEVLDSIFKESHTLTQDRDRLTKQIAGLTTDNREVGAKCLVAQQRVKELETDEEKLTAQLDKIMEKMDGIEAEKEAALEKYTKIEALIKQGEKEREALRADVKDYAGLVKELESQLVAMSEQSMCVYMRMCLCSSVGVSI